MHVGSPSKTAPHFGCRPLQPAAFRPMSCGCICPCACARRCHDRRASLRHHMQQRCMLEGAKHSNHMHRGSRDLNVRLHGCRRSARGALRRSGRGASTIARWRGDRSTWRAAASSWRSAAVRSASRLAPAQHMMSSCHFCTAGMRNLCTCW